VAISTFHRHLPVSPKSHPIETCISVGTEIPIGLQEARVTNHHLIRAYAPGCTLPCVSVLSSESSLHEGNFILSYAHEDNLEDPEKGIERFFGLLKKELHSYWYNTPLESVGFFSRQIGLGEHWNAKLYQGLADANVMIALISPRYIRGGWCAREFHAFSDRLAQYAKRRAKPAPPPLLIPIIWRKLQRNERWPHEVASLQYDNELFPKTYRAQGLIGVTSKPVFRQVVMSLATYIVNAVDNDRLTEHELPPADLESVRTTFTPDRGESRRDLPRVSRPNPAQPTSAAQPDSTAKRLVDAEIAVQDVDTGSLPKKASHVYIVVGAATSDEIERASLKPNTEYYGNDAAHWWDPYRPPHLPLAYRAGAIIEGQRRGILERGDQNWQVTSHTLLPTLVQWAKQYRQLIILLVDIWSANLDQYWRVLREFDNSMGAEQEPPLHPIFVPWSAADSDNFGRDDLLWTTISNTFPASLTRSQGPMIMLHVPLESREKFDGALKSSLAAAEAHLIRTTGSVSWSPPISEPSPRWWGPNVEGPP
jgi:FxsC-like protein